MWRFFVSVAVTIMLGFFALAVLSNAKAAGGQVQVGNPIFGDDCVAAIPAGLELTDCEEVASSPSGLQTFFVCGEITVICNSEDGGEPGRVNRGD